MGTALVQGGYWGRRAAQWARFQEPCLDPGYARVLEACAPLDAAAVLDVGCGSGRFARLADERGARVTGLDASPELIGIARRGAARIAFDVGEMEELPYPDSAFDLVTGFDSFPYAANPVNALAEAARVTRPGGTVACLVWDRPEQTQAHAYAAALASVLPPPRPGAPDPFAADPDTLEHAMAKAGLTPVARYEAQCPWVYPDHATALRGLLASGQAAKAMEYAGHDAVVEAVGAALARFRRADGSYRLDNVFPCVVAKV
jgi:SAM-dependent methyltransferase